MKKELRARQRLTGEESIGTTIGSAEALEREQDAEKAL
jgi:hypothetical protein